MTYKRKSIFHIITLFSFICLSILACNDSSRTINSTGNFQPTQQKLSGEELEHFFIVANRVVKTLINPISKIKEIPSEDTLHYYLTKVLNAGFNIVTVNLTPSNNSLNKQDQYYDNFFNALKRLNDGISKKLKCIVFDSRIRKLAPKIMLPFILKFYNRDEILGFSFDEPRENEFPHIKEWIESVKATKDQNLIKKKLFFVNLFGLKAVKDYEEYVRTFLTHLDIEVLSFDHYPVWDDSLAAKYGKALYSDWIDGYFLNLEFIRQVSSESLKPFFNWILVHRHWSSYSKLFYRRAREEDIKFQVFASLAYGVKGILYYNFWNQYPEFNNTGWNEEEGILDYDFSETELYGVISDLNLLISRAEGIILELSSTGVYHKSPNYYDGLVKSDNNEQVHLEKLFDPASESFESKYGIKLIDWNDSTYLTKEEYANKIVYDVDDPAALVGLFKGKSGSDYFLLVNKDRREKKYFNVLLNKAKLPNITELKLLDIFENLELFPVKNNEVFLTFRIDLHPGCGKLFKIR